MRIRLTASQMEEFTNNIKEGKSTINADLDQDPGFKKKLEKAKELLRKHPLPDRITGGKKLNLD